MENKVKKVWYISHYIAPPDYDTHARALKFTAFLSENNFDVTIFSSGFLHNKNINLISDGAKFARKEYNGLKFIHINTIDYHNNGIKRIIAFLQFSFRIYFLRKKFEKPDIIIHTEQIPFENIIFRLAKKMNAKYVAEILDLWPESFVAYGFIGRKNPLLKLLYKAEERIYKDADKIIFSMAGGKDYIIEKKWDTGNGGKVDLSKVHYINNGVDLKQFDYNKLTYTIDDDDLLNDKVFNVVYIGSLRHANNLRQLIDAAELLIAYPEIRFLIYGDGTERDELIDYCRKNRISNVHFKQKWIELKYVPFVLSRSSLNIINYMPSSILKYGGSQGKLFQYLASGKPICSNQRMGYCVIEENKAGISRTFTNAGEYADAILTFFNMDIETYNGYCSRARNVAKEFDYELLSGKMLEVLKS